MVTARARLDQCRVLYKATVSLEAHASACARLRNLSWHSLAPAPTPTGFVTSAVDVNLENGLSMAHSIIYQVFFFV